jgi:hypothetical protein
MRQDIDHRQAPVRQELLKYINMIRAEMTAKMVPEPVALSVALSHATAMRRRLHPVGSRNQSQTNNVRRDDQAAMGFARERRKGAFNFGAATHL